jgi:hypothetical protein
MPSGIDFNNFNYSDLIPARTIAVVQMRIRFCDDGVDGLAQPESHAPVLVRSECAACAGLRNYAGRAGAELKTPRYRSLLSCNLTIARHCDRPLAICTNGVV